MAAESNTVLMDEIGFRRDLYNYGADYEQDFHVEKS